jgi:hypothetical protein
LRYLGLVVGLGLVATGVYLLVTGLQQVLDFPLGNCFGADCFDLDAAFFTLPASIFALVIGGIVLAFSMGAIRSRNPGAFGGIGGLSALGALFVMLAVAFIVVTTTTESIVGATFILLTATFGLTGGVLLAIDQWLAARRRRAIRLRTAGMRGTATILAISDSNVTINQNPMVNLRLRVNIANHPPYEVTKRHVASRIAVGRFVPGATLPVLVDPADPTDVMIDDRGNPAAATGAGPAALPDAGLETRSAGATSATSAANGRVSLEAITDTGTELGDMRLFSFELAVQPAGGSPYRSSHAALVPSAQVPRLIRGASFPAIIDTNLPGGLGIFWDR